MRAAWPSPRAESLVAGLLLAAYAALVGWGMATQSVTFDENWHVPAGVVQVVRGDPGISNVNPPLEKLLFGAAALAAGARAPSDSSIASRDAAAVGESFMRRNADRYHRVFTAARLVSLAFALALGVLVWRAARARGGPRAGLFALALWCLAPEALAHGGVATMDVATAFGWTAFALALHAFLRSGRVAHGAALALASAFLATLRLSAFLALPVAVASLVLAAARRRLGPPRRVLVGLLLVLPVTWAALGLVYGEVPMTRAIGGATYRSAGVTRLAETAPWLRLPLPPTLFAGLDRQMSDGEPGHLTTFVLGRSLTHTVPWYFPFAIAIKWPIALLVALLARGLLALRERGRCGAGLWLPGAAFLFALLFLGVPDAGVRYALPLLPLAAIACGDLAGAPAAAGSPRLRGALATFAVVLASSLAVTTARAGPDWIPYFNAFAGDAARRERLVNDSNVDWGQGLIALRDELRRRGIHRVHLAYHGTTDPSVYGIDYVPYVGGLPGPESDWLAISSYFYVGLPARMLTAQGYTPILAYDTRPLWSRRANANPAHCMWLFRLR